MAEACFAAARAISSFLGSSKVIALRQASAPAGAMTGTPRAIVLVVEDDVLLRLLTVETVEEAGFVALEAANADEAILILEQRTDIALVIADINMPGSMDGLKLSHVVRQRWPPIRLIIVSGNAIVGDGDMPSGARFFSKPYSASKMISLLQSFVNAPPI